jgi:hypothetical protein
VARENNRAVRRVGHGILIEPVFSERREDIIKILFEPFWVRQIACLSFWTERWSDKYPTPPYSSRRFTHDHDYGIGNRQLGAGIQATNAPKIVHCWMNENGASFVSVLEENSRFGLRRSGTVAKSFIFRSIVSREMIGTFSNTEASTRTDFVGIVTGSGSLRDLSAQAF